MILSQSKKKIVPVSGMCGKWKNFAFLKSKGGIASTVSYLPTSQKKMFPKKISCMFCVCVSLWFASYEISRLRKKNTLQRKAGRSR